MPPRTRCRRRCWRPCGCGPSTRRATRVRGWRRWRPGGSSTPAAEPDARGVLALMLLNHARLPARLDGQGRIVTLDRQDRGLWDTREIAEGVRVLQSALAVQRPGRYQIEAAIAALHDDAASAE